MLRALHSASELASLESSAYYLLVARLERENNIDMIVQGFLAADTDKQLIIVGDFLDSRYQSEIDALISHDRGYDRVTFVGAVYEHDVLSMLRQHCFAYLHGHSAGGTNPSLFEAMIAQNVILAHDNPYNREVCDRFALFFNDASAVCTHIRSLEAHQDAYQGLRIGASNRAKNDYSWSRVVQKYEMLIDDVLCKK